MEKVRIQKGEQVKVIPADQKNIFLSAGWSEVAQSTRNTVGVSSSKTYGNN